MTTSLRILIIADDLTGAAEIAATATEFGIRARLSRARRINRSTVFDVFSEGATAIDTDTRLESAAHAAEVVASLQPLANTTLVYKKTDSLLRGNPGPEILALMEKMKRSSALLLPQNPSKDRVIKNGHYFIDNVPLDETSFSSDPEHPRTSSSIAALLWPTPVTIIDPGRRPVPEGIFVGNGTTLDDIAAFARELPPCVLAAGGVDFFRALLHRHFAPIAHPRHPASQPNAFRLMISGSASQYSRHFVQQLQRENYPVHPHPSDTATILGSLRFHKLAIVAITDPLDPIRSMALRQSLAASVRSLLLHGDLADQSLHVYIEGGATAAAIAEALEWRTFDVAGALAPGVVTLKPDEAKQILLTIKPGSYPWPPSFPGGM